MSRCESGLVWRRVNSVSAKAEKSRTSLLAGQLKTMPLAEIHTQNARQVLGGKSLLLNVRSLVFTAAKKDGLS